MTREVRIIVLALLTLCFYAVWGMITQSGLVFPFPINSFIFLIIAVQFTYWHYKKGFPTLLFLGVGIFGVLQNLVLWEAILPLTKLNEFVRYPWLTWFHLFYGTGIAALGIFFLVKQTSEAHRILIGLGLASFSFGFYTGYSFWEFLGFGFIAISMLTKPVEKPIHLLWILLFALESTKWITYALAA